MVKTSPFSCLPFPVDPDQTHPHPWLLVSQGENLQSHTFYSVSENKYLKKNIPEFRNKQISHTSYGWIAVIDVAKSPFECCLVNIASGEKIQLPHIEEDPKSERGLCCQCILSKPYRCILSKPPTDSDCHVLLLSCFDSSLLFCRLGDEKFVKRTTNFLAATNYNGKIIAWMSQSGNFAEIDFMGQELIPKQLMNNLGQPCRIPWPSPSTSPFFADYLVESCGGLLLVHVICHHHSAEVAYFRIFRVHECLELTSIGDRTIFLGPFGRTCITCSDKSGIKKNSIYYTWYDRYLYVYDIEDRSKTLLKPCSMKRGGRSLMSWLIM